MKYKLLPVSLLLASLLAFITINARNPYTSAKHNSYKNERSGCNIPVDSADLDINNVRARLLDAGDQWWNLTNGLYEVPKRNIDTPSTHTPQAIFAGAIWVSALDQGNNLKMAALEYRQGTSDYYTGPLDNNGNVTLATCSQWDRHFKVYATDIIPCIQAYQASGNQSVPPSVVSANDSNMVRWPGKGNPYLSAQGYDVSGVLAPFFDANGDGIYNPLDGDYPALKQAGTNAANAGTGCDALISNSCANYADEMIFWVMNDVGNTHTASGGSPLGIQVNELAFAFQDTNVINDATFYTYNIINKSGAVLNRAYFSQWTDVDLGCANNDRVGCDTSRSLAIQYNGYVANANQLNGVTCDEGSVCPTGEVGYECDLPMLAIQFLQGATDTTIDPATQLPKQLGMTSFCYFTNGAATGQSDPTTAVGFRNYQTGFWNDGTPITYSGNGYGGSTPFPYCFPGDPSLSTQWSECNQQTGGAIAAGDRRFVQTSGPFTFMPCASQFFTIAVLFVDPPGGVGTNCPSWSSIDSVADSTQALFNRCFFHPNPLYDGVKNIQSNSFKAYPNPVTDFLYFTSAGQQPINEVSVYDLMGRLVISQSGNTSSIDMSQLSDGVYFVKTNTDSQQTFKIVKK